MPYALTSLRREFHPMMRLALPLALAELGWMAMGVVDTVMVGPLGAAAIGASSLGATLFYTVAIFGVGLLLGMDTVVAQAFGAGDQADCRRTLVNGTWLAVLLAAPLAAVAMACLPLLRAFGANPHVLELLGPYLRALAWSILPLLLYSAFRRYLQAMNVVRPVTFALISANLVNFAGNWIFIYGHWGAPAMGVEGSGWSTCFARVYMAAVLLGAIVHRERRSGGMLFRMPWLPEFSRILRLAALGLPAAMQIGIEGGVFAVVTAFAGKLDEASLAAHSIAVNVISVTFMVPLGISSAAAVRVGQAVGAGDRRGAATSGWTALALSAAFMGSAGAAMLIAPRWILRVYSADPDVLRIGVVLLGTAALFQLFDGFQVVATGALRGLGDTSTPMLAHLAGDWAVGLPVAYLLCFRFRWGAAGLWVGLCAALVLIGAALVAVWHYQSRRYILQKDQSTLV